METYVNTVNVLPNFDEKYNYLRQTSVFNSNK